LPPNPHDAADLWKALQRSYAERERAQTQLAEREALLSLFVENAPAAIAMFDREMCYLAVSRRFIEDYKIDRDLNPLGHSHYEIFPKFPRTGVRFTSAFWLARNSRTRKTPFDGRMGAPIGCAGP